MVNDTANLLLRHLRKLTAPVRHTDPDHELLRRFSGQCDEGAFEELLRRHGGMVLGVCQRMLRHRQDAEDAFQATFLTLARKAASIRKREAVGCWLHSVARRLALQTRTAAARRRTHEGQIAERTLPDPLAEITLREAQGVLDAELARLPERLRAPLVLCHLEGATRDEAARQLGWSLATLKRRLEQGRELLRLRLARRGLAPSAALLAVLLAEKGTAGVPAALASATVNAALLFGTGQMPAAGTVSAQAIALAEGMARAVLLTKLKIGAVLVLALSVLAIGVGLAAHQAGAGGPENGEGGPKPAARLPDQAKSEGKGQARTDQNGNPLPPGALMRLGTVRLRHEHLFGATFSPDGKLLASHGGPGGDGTVRLWDPADGKLLRQLPGHKHFASSIAFSPDGKLLASGDVKWVRLWDVATGKELRKHSGYNPDRIAREANLVGVYALAFSPDGKLLAVGEGDQTIRLWDVTTGKEVRQLGEHRSQVRSLAFTPDGKTLISCQTVRGYFEGHDAGLRFWDVTTGQEIRRILGEQIEENGCTAMSPDGKTLAVGGVRFMSRTPQGSAYNPRGYLTLYDVVTGKVLHELKGLPRQVLGAAFSPDGKTLSWGGWDSIHFWDVAAVREVLQVAVAPSVSRFTFSPDGKTLAGRGTDTIRLWDVATGREIERRPGHEAEVTSVAFAADGQTLLSVSREDHTIRFWDPATGKQRQLLRGDYPHFSHAIFCPDGRRVIVDAGRDKLGLWDAATGQELRQFSLSAPDRKSDPWLRAVALSPDGKTLTALTRYGAGGSEEADMVLAWDVTTGKELLCRKERGKCAGLSPDGKTVAQAAGQVLALREAATGKLLNTLSATGLQENESACFHPTFSADGKLLAAVSRTSTGREDRAKQWEDKVHLWELATGQEVLSLPTGSIAALAFAPDGRTLTTAAGPADHDGWRKQEDTSVRLWDVATGNELLRLDEHGSSVTCLAFAPDGKALACGMRDTTVLLWDLTPGLRRVGPPAKNLGPGEFDRLWADLAGEAPKARPAIGSLVASASQAVPLLKGRLRPAAEVPAERIRQLLADLDSDAFATRRAAFQDLEKLDTQAEPALREALAGNPSAEVRRQVETMLDAPPLLVRSPEVLRRLRAIQVLEQVGTPEAQQVLRHLAEGAPRARETREARMALQRLDRRPLTP